MEKPTSAKVGGAIANVASAIAPIVSWCHSSGTMQSAMSDRASICCSKTRRVLSRPGSRTSVVRGIKAGRRLDLNLVAQFDSAVRRDAEEGLGGRGRMGERDEPVAAPF